MNAIQHDMGLEMWSSCDVFRLVAQANHVYETCRDTQRYIVRIFFAGSWCGVLRVPIIIANAMMITRQSPLWERDREETRDPCSATNQNKARHQCHYSPGIRNYPYQPTIFSRCCCLHCLCRVGFGNTHIGCDPCGDGEQPCLDLGFRAWNPGINQKSLFHFQLSFQFLLVLACW